MKLITRNTDYAIRILICMARRKGDACSTAEYVHRDLGVSLSFVRKIMQQLGQHGLLISCRGKGGGFALGRAPKDISLTEIIAVTQGPLKFNDCDEREHSCRSWCTCRMRGALKELEKCVSDQTDKITLAGLFNENTVAAKARIPVKIFKPKRQRPR